MIEWEWLHGTSLLHLMQRVEDRLSDRKLRLFMISCFQPWRDKLSIEGQNLLDIGEKVADGLATEADVAEVRESATMWMAVFRGVAFADVASKALATTPLRGALAVAHFFEKYRPADSKQNDEEVRYRCEFFRHIIGNPFRPVSFDRNRLTPTIINMAQAIYDDRPLPSCLFDNHRMGVLADALEEAGCDSADLLGHLRGGGEHVRGCHVIDLLLGKE